MSDYQQGSDAVETEAQAEVETKHPFYDTPEPRPTEEVENEEIVADSEEEVEPQDDQEEEYSDEDEA